jgi:hypothetical protein
MKWEVANILDAIGKEACEALSDDKSQSQSYGPFQFQLNKQKRAKKQSPLPNCLHKD